MSTPDLSPLIAAQLICHKCGKTLDMRVVMGRKGKETVVDHLEYKCVNPETDCNYKVVSYVMASGEMTALRRDGSEVKVPE